MAGGDAAERDRMVAEQIGARGVRSEAVLAAMRRVPRDRFVPDDQRAHAYEDRPLPIGDGQTISQPYIVGFMSELLDVRKTDRVLEIGTGSGYQAAVLAELAGEVFTIETVPALADRAKAVLSALGYANIHARTGNGYRGWPEAAPFDRILLTAAPPAVPQALVDQLAHDGMLVAPVGPQFGAQTIVVVRRHGGAVTTTESLAVQFVPMVDR